MAELAEARPLLSRVQRLVLDFIREHVRDHGYPPTIRQIGARAGVTSTSSVSHQIKQLELKGYLERDPFRQRALRVVGGGPEDSSVPRSICEVVDDLVDAWHQLARSDIGDVSLAEFLQLRPAEQTEWACDAVLPGRLHPYWRWLHRSLALPRGDAR
ncbi:hypothetical protein GCM10009613_60890 [Pseudonocardia kongjuensis]|uniref:LexA repressor DNA-binding domain-containing protein n=1 Tax=Pseudonocardia kongjuensis TaxID=102227 RepID=A0ABN1Y9S0_9PSEU